MKVDVLLGLQWGDEGKGKIVDVLTPGYDVIARFQGGPNAGHSLEFNRIKHVLHSIPSGIFHSDQVNIIGNGVVLDPVIFMKETESIRQLGVDIRSKLMISRKAHLILPSHRILDAASEASKGLTKIGSTLKGIGPTYMDKTGRNGLRVGDLLKEDFIELYNNLKKKHINILKQYDYNYNIEENEESWFRGVDEIRSFKIVDSEYEINKYLSLGKNILAEGAQGTMLDIDFGSYPFVTSSNTISAAACTGLGIAPARIGRVMGVFKAYCTRVGSGPFPTELDNETGELLRSKGGEFGATTGRPRRCGWLDLPALKYSIMLSGVTDLIMTKADILSGFDTIKVCTAYKTKYGTTDRLPYDLDDVVEPVYTQVRGWTKELNVVRSIANLPAEMISYIELIEKETGVRIGIVSTGPDREQILYRN